MTIGKLCDTLQGAFGRDTLVKLYDTESHQMTVTDIRAFDEIQGNSKKGFVCNTPFELEIDSITVNYHESRMSPDTELNSTGVRKLAATVLYQACEDFIRASVAYKCCPTTKNKQALDEIKRTLKSPGMTPYMVILPEFTQETLIATLTRAVKEEDTNEEGQKIIEKFRSKQNAEIDLLGVSDATCQGCRHYASLKGRTSPDACHYSLDTNHLRPRGETPAKCSVKVVQNRKRYMYERNVARKAYKERLREYKRTHREDDENG